MNLRSLLAGVPLTGGTSNLDVEISSISYDSRTLEPGALFVALPGDKTERSCVKKRRRSRGLLSSPRIPGWPWPWCPAIGLDIRGTR